MEGAGPNYNAAYWEAQREQERKQIERREERRRYDEFVNYQRCGGNAMGRWDTSERMSDEEFARANCVKNAVEFSFICVIAIAGLSGLMFSLV